jgi:hypothetical protein
MPLRFCSIFSFIVLFMAADLFGGTTGSVEEYRYISFPTGGDAARRETIEMKIVSLDQIVRYETKSSASSAMEEIWIYTDPAGRLASASRKWSSDGREKADRIWRENRTAYLQQSLREGKAARAFDIPPGKDLAVDGSLLLFFRSFPFDTGEARSVFMLDFSGASVTVTVRHGGSETITVPAGRFDCYRMEVIVELPLLHPKITYWITKRRPHFMVRSVGQRGPFTSSYVTSLVSVLSPQ